MSFNKLRIIFSCDKRSRNQIFARIKTGSGKLFQKYTGLQLPEGATWGGRKNWVTSTEELHITINQSLLTIKQGLLNSYLKLKSEKLVEPSPKDVVEHYFGQIETCNKTFRELITDYLVARPVKPNTALIYRKNITLITSKFFAYDMGDDNPSIARIDGTTLYRFQIWMRQQQRKSGVRKYQQGTIDEYTFKIKALMEFATQVGYIKENPTEKFRSKRKKSDPNTIKSRLVSPEDLYIIENTPVHPHRWRYEDHTVLETIRNIFLLQCWTGLSYVDLCRIGSNVRDYITTDMTGKKSLVYNRVKTDIMAIVPIFPQTERLLEALNYNVDPHKTGLSQAQVAYRFKRLFKLYGFSYWKKVGLHTGRHIFGSEMLNLGFSMEAVSRMMGHSSIIQTQRAYAKIDGTKISTEFDRINSRSDIEPVQSVER